VPRVALAPLITLALVSLPPLLPGQAPAPPPARTPGESAVELRSRRLGVMGTELFIEALGPDPARLEAALDAAVAEIRRVEDLMTDWRPSPLMTLNAAAGRGPQPAAPELVRILGQAGELHTFTRGAFDVTFAAVGRLWDFKAKPPRPPSREAVEAALPFVDGRRITVDAKQGTVTIPEGMSVGLGGIAKGYGVDRAMAILMAHGITDAMVNAGGDLKALGRRRGAPWEVAIQHPREPDRVIAVIPVANTCVVTSGDYERFFELDGERYHHILDPRTGFPCRGCISATVVAPEAALADALATALCVLGPEASLPLIEKLPRVEALMVDLDGRVHASSGLLDHAPAGGDGEDREPREETPDDAPPPEESDPPAGADTPSEPNPVP